MRTTGLKGQVNLTRAQEREIDRLFKGISEHRGRRNLSIAEDEADDECTRDQDPGMADGMLASWRDEGRNDHLDGDPITGEDPFQFPAKDELREMISDTSASFEDSLPGPQERAWHGPSSLTIGNGIQVFMVKPHEYNGDATTEAAAWRFDKKADRMVLEQFTSRSVLVNVVPTCPQCGRPLEEDETRNMAQFLVRESWTARKRTGYKTRTFVCVDCHHNRSPRGSSGLFTKAEREKLRILPPPPFGENMHYALKA